MLVTLKEIQKASGDTVRFDELDTVARLAMEADVKAAMTVFANGAF